VNVHQDINSQLSEFGELVKQSSREGGKLIFAENSKTIELAGKKADDSRNH
jgi:hypothetical protein